jgi:GTP-binding protein YchF
VERLGLVGLPNSGKSSLFNALTGGSALVAAHPFSTTTTSVGTAYLPDKRLDALAQMSKSRRVVRAGFEVVDIASLVAGSAHGEGLGNKFLAGIREVDALLMVVRSFHDDQVSGESDPVAGVDSLELELVLADLATAEAQLAKWTKAAKSAKKPPAEIDSIKQAIEVLGEGTPLYRSRLGEDIRASLSGLFLLTNKPVLVVVNLGEDQLSSHEEILRPVAEHMGEGAQVLGMCVQLEAEAARLPEEEREGLLMELGLGEGALPRVAAAAYHLLSRRTFFTTGEKESRAWTFKVGAHAPECAGVIHSDLQRGFIRAEVIHWDELISFGSWAAARSAGKIRLEGKDYEVQDGDVLEIRFNV